MKVLKISPIPWDRASRDQRELAALKESGVECLVFSKGGPKDKARKTEIAGFPVYLYDARPFGNARRLSPLNKAVTILRWARYIKTYRADILSCHDLPALLIGWLSTCCMPRRAKPKLVYDSHEFEIARNKDRTRAAVWFVTCLERFLIKRCAFTIMCCFCAADEVRKIYKLQERPIVVRNTPGFWLIDEVVIRQTRRELLSKLGVSRIILTLPVGYLTSISLTNRAKQIVTDSGGLQREAFFAGKQCITIMDYVAWPETMVNNRNQLSKPNADEILRKLSVKQTVDPNYRPFGDGHAAEKIADAIVMNIEARINEK